MVPLNMLSLRATVSREGRVNKEVGNVPLSLFSDNIQALKVLKFTKGVGNGACEITNIEI